MPTSIDPQPAEDEIECANCGAYVYIGLTRCPNCGVNLYEPETESGEDQAQPSHHKRPHSGGFFAGLDRFVRQITKRPYPADELFGAAINQAELFNNLLLKVGGERAAVERLIDYERRQFPDGNRLIWLEKAIRRWEQDNRGQELK
jgi:hypothetical protein